MIEGAPGLSLTQSLQRSCGWLVYACMAQDGTLLYVGMTGRGSARLAEHVGKPWWVAVDCIHLFHMESEEQARREEKSFIRELKPLFNVNARPTGPPTLMPSYWALRTRADEQEEIITDLRDQLAVLQEMRGADDD
jgi:predicted GIY-YIG superfamily endonuclease